jgi:hypothetical protein
MLLVIVEGFGHRRREHIDRRQRCGHIVVPRQCFINIQFTITVNECRRQRHLSNHIQVGGTFVALFSFNIHLSLFSIIVLIYIWPLQLISNIMKRLQIPLYVFIDCVFLEFSFCLSPMVLL